MTEHVIEAERTPRGSLIVGWPSDAGDHDRLISALADQLEDEMTADRSLRRVVLTVQIATAEPTTHRAHG